MRTRRKSFSGTMNDAPRAEQHQKSWLGHWTNYRDSWLEMREKWLPVAEEDETVREKLRTFAAGSFEGFTNLFVTTFDPRAQGPKSIPMILFPIQITLGNTIMDSYVSRKDLLIEKSRDMGATWELVAWVTWRWLFEPGFRFLWGSRKEAAVDDRTTESIFGKHDHLIANLPVWLIPKSYLALKRNRKKLFIGNPENGNTIAGESTNENFSRSGRYSAIGLDEFASWNVDALAWEATADSSPVRYIISTPKGRGNKFAELRFPGPKGPKIQVFTMHWKDHPDKDEAWYTGEQQRRKPEELAQEVDISYERSVKDRVYSDFDRHKQARDNIDYDPNLPLEFGWDFGVGTTAVLWIQPGPGYDLRIIDELEMKAVDIDSVVKELIARADKVGYPPPSECRHYGDPAGRHRVQLQGLLSVVQRLGTLGIRVDVPPKVACSYENRIRTTGVMLKFTRISKSCRRTVECFENYRYPETYNPMAAEKQKPLINQFSHLVTAFEYWSLMQPQPELGDLSLRFEREDEIEKRRYNEILGSIKRPWEPGGEVVVLDPTREAWV